MMSVLTHCFRMDFNLACILDSYISGTLAVGGGVRILLIEDEEKVSRFVVRGLVAAAFAVDAAYDGISGLEYATTYSYDLIILDLMLPELSGTEVLRQIRRTYHSVPVRALTARDAIADKVENFEIGADDYLSKP